MSRIKRYTTWVVAMLVTYVLGLELSLHAANWFIQETEREPIAGWVGFDTRVLALGDSNTYGLFLPAAVSYPEQMEALWNVEVESPKVEVINLGYPGTNTSVLLRNLPELLDTFEPDIVLVMIGINDFWTDVVSREDDEENIFDRMMSWLRQNSRVYKLVYIIRRGLYDPGELDLGERLEVHPEAMDAEATSRVLDSLTKNIEEGKATRLSEVRYGDQKFELGYVAGTGNPGNLEITSENVETVVTEIERKGIQAILLTYPADHRRYRRMNKLIREVANATGVPLVDIAKAVAEQCPDSTECPDLFFPDGHAKRPGYAIAARKLVDDLRESEILLRQ